MSKLRVFYILSIIIVGVLLVRVFLWPLTGGEERYSEVQREQLLQAQDEWIVQFDIINREGKDIRYTVDVSFAGKEYNEQFLIQDGGIYTYIHHIGRDVAGSGEVGFTVYKEAEQTSFEQATYYLK